VTSTHQESHLDRSAYEEDDKEEDPKVDEDIGTEDADDLPQEVDGEHAVDAQHYQKHGEGNSVAEKGS